VYDALTVPCCLLLSAACSCTVLAASLVVEKGRLALLAMLAVINIAVVSIFLFHIIKQMWLWVGAPAKRAVVTAYRNSRVWWTQHVTVKLLPCLRRFGCNCVMWCTSCCGRKLQSQGSQPGSQQDSQADAQQQGLQQLADGQQQADGQSGNAGQQRRQKPVQQQAATGHHLQAADGQQVQQAPVQPTAQQQQQQIQQIQLVRR